MPIRWKTSKRFNPALVIEKIDEVRTVNPEGGVSYSGFELHENLPVLQSMLEFPPASKSIDESTLIWAALGKVRTSLTQANFIEAINRELKDRLATREKQYFLVTAMSLNPVGLPKSFCNSGVIVQQLGKRHNIFLREHRQIISNHTVPVDSTPDNYSWVIAEVKAKSVEAAFSKTMHAIDLQRAIWCLMGNTTMSIGLAGVTLEPINVIRSGGSHTLHNPDGSPASQGLWFEPNFVPARTYRFSTPAIVVKNSKWALRRINNSNFGDRIAEGLVRYVRALDQVDSDSAFVRLWGALESLVTPEVADYEALVRRCAFLHQDVKYHRQVLEHLREYRNMHLHGGSESRHSRIHCYQLQFYFVHTAWFFIRNAGNFSSISEANEFLDQSTDITVLKRQLELSKKAIRFVSPP